MSEVDIKPLFMPKDRFGDSLRDHDMPLVYRTAVLTRAADVAVEMAARWAMVAAMPDGEDSAGRQKLRCLEPDELADKACRTAQALWSRFERLGWVVSIPDPVLREKKETEKA